MKHKNLLLFSAAVMLIAASFISTATAYFTASSEASGGYTVSLWGKREFHEKVEGRTKTVWIVSQGNTDCFVRARAYVTTGFDVVYDAEPGWVKGRPGFNGEDGTEWDGWYYYEPVLTGHGQSTTNLKCTVDNLPDDPNILDSFTMTVVYESVPALYHEDGTPYADWDHPHYVENESKPAAGEPTPAPEASPEPQPGTTEEGGE